MLKGLKQTLDKELKENRRMLPQEQQKKNNNKYRNYKIEDIISDTEKYNNCNKNKSLNGFNNRYEQAEERINEFEGRSTEINQSEQQKEKMKKNKQHPRDLWGWKNTHCGAYGKSQWAKQVAEILEQGQAVHNREIHAF